MEGFNYDIVSSFVLNLRVVMNSLFDYVIEIIIYWFDIIIIIIGCDDWYGVRNVCFFSVRIVIFKMKFVCVSDNLLFIYKIIIWWREYELFSIYCIVGIYSNVVYRFYVVSIILFKKYGCVSLFCF